MSKSSVLNLYDAINGSNHFQVKTFSDKVDFSSSTLPLNLKATLVNLQNADGQIVSDVAGTILSQVAALSQEVSDRQAAVLSESVSRISSDAALQSNINDEISDRTAAISAEASVRSAANNTLQSNINDEVSARTAAVTAEASVRSGADATLQFNLDTEATVRSNADTTLQTKIDQEVIDRTAAISAEASARTIANTTFQSTVDQETSDRQAAISTEADARSSANVILQSNINTESSARSNADEALSTKITVEKSARLVEVAVERSRIDAILQGTSIDFNQLQELINAYTTSDNSILNQIGIITSNITAIQAQLNGTDDKLNSLIADVVVGADDGAEEPVDEEPVVVVDPPKEPAYIMTDRSLLGDYNLVTFKLMDGSALSSTQMNALIGTSFTIGDNATVYTITENNNSFKLLTNVYVGNDKPIPSNIFLV